MFYTAKKCLAIRRRAAGLHLSAPASFWRASGRELSRCLNGTGPDSWPDWARRAMSFVYRAYKATVAIHDWEFQHANDGTARRLAGVNGRFARNASRELEYAWPLRIWQVWPQRLCAWNKKRLAVKALRLFSYGSWAAAYARYCKKVR